MLGILGERKLNAEMIATLLFILISAIYILNKFGFEKLMDVLFFWMFPASIMIFLTLVMVRLIERAAKKRAIKSYKYLNIHTE